MFKFLRLDYNFLSISRTKIVSAQKFLSFASFVLDGAACTPVFLPSTVDSATWWPQVQLQSYTTVLRIFSDLLCSLRAGRGDELVDLRSVLRCVQQVEGPLVWNTSEIHIWVDCYFLWLDFCTNSRTPNTQYFFWLDDAPHRFPIALSDESLTNSTRKTLRDLHFRPWPNIHPDLRISSIFYCLHNAETCLFGSGRQQNCSVPGSFICFWCRKLS